MPVAEHVVDEPLVRALLAQLPAHLSDVRGQPVTFVAEGWDNSVWRVGWQLAARVARRSLAVELLENEARWLDVVAAPMRELGVAAPSPVHLSPAGDLHPLPWLLTTWVEGRLLEDLPVEHRWPALRGLLVALPALHRPADEGAPHNPFRAPPIARMPAPRDDVVSQARTVLGTPTVKRLLTVHESARRAPSWPGVPLWCHGDLHPLNLVLADETLGLLDFGDLTGGDPAVDLGVLWTAFDEEQRGAAVEELTPHYDEHVWTRAKGWAARLVLGVAGNDPSRFDRALRHAVAQILG